MIWGVGGIESGHALTVAVAHPQGEIRGDDAFVAEPTEEASVSVIVVVG